MAGPLKNISLLLSPKILSPLSPSKNITNVCDGKELVRQINRSNVAKKLNFSTTANYSNSVSNSKIPDIRIHQTVDIFHSPHRHKIPSPSSPNYVLDINTPIKHDLGKNGIDKFKNRTTILGRGTFGTVFKGRYKGKSVAVKIVTKRGLSGERNGLNLHHKNIVETLEIIESTNNQMYNLIIMEYLPNNRNLQDTLESTRNKNIITILDDLFKKIAIDITMGLQYLHSMGIIHLDLKPNNILIDTQNNCRICDFGNSIREGESLENFEHKGTIVYTAPEILLGNLPSKKSDIYSLGLLFWQIRHLKMPFEEYESTESIIYNVGKYNVRPTCQCKDSDSLTTLFTKCWNINPDHRPDTATVLLDLQNIYF